MPSHRKRSTPQPARRPQVAGLRKPQSKPSPQPRPRPTPYSAQYEDLVDEHEGTAVDAEPVTPEREHEEPESRPSPAPRPKSRDTGKPKPATADSMAAAPEPAEEPEAPAASRAGDGEGRDKAVVSIIAVLALVFALIAGFFAFKLVDAYSTTSNQAISDAVGTEGVQKDVTAAVESLLSYDYNKIDEHEKTARSLLVTDQVRDEFDKLYGDVKKKAPEQKIVLVTKVSYSSVLELDGDTAKVLLFVEQSASREGTDQKSSGGGQLTVDAQLQDGKWRLAGINTYGPIKPPAN